MSRFNEKKEYELKVKNHEAAPAYSFSNEVELYSLVCTSFLADKYYESESDQLIRLQKLVKACSPKFVANLASYARKEMSLRTMPVVLTGLLTRNVGGPLARRAVSRIVQRPDEIVELLAYFSQLNKRNWKEVSKGSHKSVKKMGKYSHSLKRGLADVFTSGKFDEYQFSKWNKKKEFSFKDALFLSNPKPKTPEMVELFGKIANDTLKTADTWEVRQSKLGQTNKGVEEEKVQERKLAVWAEMIEKKKLGHMALLRNLNNILTSSPNDEFVVKVCAELVRGAKHGKQLPFRYWSAFVALAEKASSINDFHLEMISKALDAALLMSVKTLGNFEGRTLVACDVSGSMFKNISDKSIIRNVDIGVLLGSLFKSDKENTIVGIFGDTFKVIPNLGTGILNNTGHLLNMANSVGYCTYGYKVLEYLNQKNVEVQQVMVFTDAQVYGEVAPNRRAWGDSKGNEMERQWNMYKSKFPNAKLYLFDMSGYGTTPLRLDGGDVIHVAGWSDRIFEAVEYLKKGKTAVDMIMEYEG